jgi:glycosyltransferase involved in cell wall biosynthesis
MKPRVSIVTISFNQAPYLERAILSVLQQGYENIDYIVVDPGSTDGSREIIERYRSRISKVILEPDKGPANGLNKGFAAATGEIYGYINSDDAFLPGAIGKAVAAMEARPSADVVFGHSFIVDENGKMVRRSRSVPFTVRGYAYGSVVVMQQSTFFRRKSFESVGGFNESNRVSWDAELLVDIALRGGRLEMVDEFWSIFAIYPASITGSGKYQQLALAEHVRVFQKITGLEYSRVNKTRFYLARLEKWVKNPRVPVGRLKDLAFGVSQLPLRSSST